MYSVPEKKEHTEYALEAASKLLEFYNTFFEINYPLKKLGEQTPGQVLLFLFPIFLKLFLNLLLSDLVAIPDFLAGAMENWGLITFRETTLLVGTDSSPLEKQVVASVVAHELAHQVVFSSLKLTWKELQLLIPPLTAVVWKPGNHEVVERPVAQ